MTADRSWLREVPEPAFDWFEEALAAAPDADGMCES